MAAKKQTLQRPEIREVSSMAERVRVYRFWYDTYVTEMRRPVKDPDHGRQLLTDCLEDHSTVLAAHAGTEIVGTVRVNFCSRGSIGHYENLYGIDRSGYDRTKVAIVTKYMVGARYRATPLPFGLACAGLVECVERGIAAAFMDCNDHLFDYFSMLGFEECIRAVHPEFGPVRVMKYDLVNPHQARGILGGYLKSSLRVTSGSDRVRHSSE